MKKMRRIFSLLLVGTILVSSLNMASAEESGG